MGRKSNEQKKKEKQAEYFDAWSKEKMKMYSFRLSKANESDLIKKLESVPSKKNYIADLIREDLKKGH